jgi:hypothetical protein
VGKIWYDSTSESLVKKREARIIRTEVGLLHDLETMRVPKFSMGQCWRRKNVLGAVGKIIIGVG